MGDPDQKIFSEYNGSDEYFVMPDDVTEIAEGTFARCRTLRHVDLRNVRTIGARAFQECSELETVIMSRAVHIGAGAFEFCRSLRSVTFGCIDEIGEGAFSYCGMLDIPEIPRSLTAAGTGAFSHTALKRADLHWFREIPSSLFSFCTSLGYADISGAKVIGDDAFAGCKALSYVRLGDTLSIGDRAFNKCDSLEIAGLPETLRGIGDDAFAKVSKGLVIPRGVRHIGKNCFGPADVRKNVRVFRSGLYGFRNYFRDDRVVREYELEEEHFYLWESSIDVTVLDDETGGVTGFLPLFSDLDPVMRRALDEAFRPDNTFDYQVLDTVFPAEMKWNQKGKDRLAVRRLMYPYDLSPSAAAEYTDYLRKHAGRIARRAVKSRDIDILVFLCDNDMISGEIINDILDYSISMSASECTAFLLERQAELGRRSDPLLEEL